MSGNHIRNVTPMMAAQRCGAKTRAGGACAAPAVAGGQRCRMHGGRGSGAPVGNANALKHGAYDREMRARLTQVRALRKQARYLLEMAELM